MPLLMPLLVPLPLPLPLRERLFIPHIPPCQIVSYG